jgi:hypothetical protein
MWNKYLLEEEKKKEKVCQLSNFEANLLFIRTQKNYNINQLIKFDDW